MAASAVDFARYQGPRYEETPICRSVAPIMPNPSIDTTELGTTQANAQQHLLDCRNQAGHWRGQLSASALSTATAIAALTAYRDQSPVVDPEVQPVIEQGLRWLVQSQNADGGWGDTVKSYSNLSTTAIGWAACEICGARADYPDAVEAAQAWIQNSAGSLEPQILSQKIADRYGKDRTFSVPILTTLAIAHCLGDSAQAWKWVPQLPFELAAFPQSWFHLLQLPVVSYALPALIAIGQVRHHHRPSRNPLLRVARNATRSRTLRVLRSVQPESGGFLEATPLTSFVVLSLCHSDAADHEVTRSGVQFLKQSMLEDGSWPIDTDLATWVTTLSVNGLSNYGEQNPLTDDDRSKLLDWLLAQQYRTIHPYTRAAPGGWAWTDLTGGVPDADDTPGALLAVHQLRTPTGPTEQRSQCLAAAEAGVTWLLDLQNRDGGIPTFCRGWGNLPFDRSSADLTAHTLRAWLTWHDELPARTQSRIRRSVQKATSFLVQQQRENGVWVPLWFGNQDSPAEENPTYGTTRVLLCATLTSELGQQVADTIDVPRAVAWLLTAQNTDGGWGGDVGMPSTLEETAFGLEALAALWQAGRATSEQVARAIDCGCQWLMEHTEFGTRFPVSPIGFYFAKLWYFEQLYPVVFVVSALGRFSSQYRQRP